MATSIAGISFSSGCTLRRRVDSGFGVHVFPHSRLVAASRYAAAALSSRRRLSIPGGGPTLLETARKVPEPLSRPRPNRFHISAVELSDGQKTFTCKAAGAIDGRNRFTVSAAVWTGSQSRPEKVLFRESLQLNEHCSLTRATGTFIFYIYISIINTSSSTDQCRDLVRSQRVRRQVVEDVELRYIVVEAGKIKTARNTHRRVGMVRCRGQALVRARA